MKEDIVRKQEKTCQAFMCVSEDHKPNHTLGDDRPTTARAFLLCEEVYVQQRDVYKLGWHWLYPNGVKEITYCVYSGSNGGSIIYLSQNLIQSIYV